MHKLLQAELSVGTGLACSLIVFGNVIGRFAGSEDYKGNWLTYMDAFFNRCGMVRKKSNRHRFVPRENFIEYGSCQALVEIFDSPNFQVEIAVMACFICSLNMEKNEIVGFQRLYGCFCFSFIIGIGEACSSFNFYGT